MRFSSPGKTKMLLLKKNKLIIAAKLSLIIALGASSVALADVTMPVPDTLDPNVTTQIKTTVNTNDTYQIIHTGAANQSFNNKWKSFDVPENKYADFNFSNSGQVSVNKITGANSSQIYGHITQSGAGGTVYLINSSGVLFGKNSSVNLNSLVVSTYDMKYQDVLNKKIQFGGVTSGSIINQGNIKVSDGGFIAFLAPVIENTGTINVPIGTIALVSGKNVTFDMNDGQQISLELDDSTVNNLVLDSDKSQIHNAGLLKSDGGNIFIKTDRVNELISKVVNNDGIIEANTLTKINGDLVFGNIDIDGTSGTLTSTGAIRANGIQGGNIKIASAFTGLGGSIEVLGDKGGNVSINSDTLSLAGNIKATGTTNSGGNVNINTTGKNWETSTSVIDASGSTGGSISNIAEQQITTSGKYLAKGTSGIGGNIDITSSALKFLSSEIDASGYTGGGKIQLGGEYQGGKNLLTDEIPNAQTLAMTSGTSVKADTTGNNGDGGTIISWADEKSAVFGNFSAKQGTLGGNGGLIEVSSGNELTFGGKANAGVGGTFLLDPKNITIADINFSQYPLLIGYNYSTMGINNGDIDSNDGFGASVSLDGNRLAVGAYLDSGFNNLNGNSGAVYLYSFTDSLFSGGNLESIIGSGYTGGKNINQALDAIDKFGSAVSLDGNRLAVGAVVDDGFANSKSNSGAVYLYSFTDSLFSGGNLEATIGNGYTGGKNIDQPLDSDYFGRSLSLDGNRLAVGAYYNDGFENTILNSGVVYLYSFTDSLFSGGTLESTIGSGYTGGKNINQSLDINDYFGYSVSLDGNRLAVGAYADDGFENTILDSGAVYLYSFTDSLFSGGTLEATLGSGYTGGKNIDKTLDVTDYFGGSVSLDGNRLAVGAYADDGFGNLKSNSGAVYLYSFTDSLFTDGNLEATIGLGYIGGKNIDKTLDINDNFGNAVSLDENRLAVGAYQDDGFGNLKADSGAVYLYSFTDSLFSGGNLEATIGNGYTDGKNINQALDGSDYLGRAVSLDGNRLAIGAHYDSGFNNLNGNSGAVYLYSFTDSLFSGGNLEGIIGSGYTGGKNINQALDSYDLFGSAVSLDENKLAVGAYYDDGFENTKYNSGAVYLYSFTDSLFSGGNLEATIGNDFTGGKNINLALNNSDYFGYSVSLDGNRLAVGAFQDDGFGNLKNNSGAVYLYSFTDSLFSGGTLESTIGSGYTGDKNINQALDAADYFGSAVSIDENRLAIGAYYDDGFGNTTLNSGAVYLYSFTDSLFSDGNLEATIGNGYTGGKNIDKTLDISDYFGYSVSLDGNKLAVGAYSDDGFGNLKSDSGAIYLYSFTDSLFSDGNLEATIGSGYTSGKNIDQTLDGSDFLGTSLSLDGNRLAVGAYYDDGFINKYSDTGAVYLYSFTDSLFSGGTLENIIGYGYIENNGINQVLGATDLFGTSVSLDGNRLAVGATQDDGFGNTTTDTGAVYLYSFTDSLFSGGTLESIIGNGYTGGKNINQTLEASDKFGMSVSLDENRLAVGAYADDGFENSKSNSGAVYLYSFTDSLFSGGNLEATIGNGYTGGKNISMVLGTNDYFGMSVSLDGNRLATSAYYDDGFGNTLTNSGAVYLYSFTDSLFSGGNLEATIGNGYTGGKNIDHTLEAADYFGYSVSLDGNKLAVGAILDDGFGNATTDSGAVSLYSFTDSLFSGGTLEATIGNGYTGGKNIDHTLEAADYFGSAVSLDGNRLAVGAYQDDGFGNTLTNSGAINLYSFTDNLFSGGNLEATIGNDYTGGKNINQSLDAIDYFGRSISLDGNRLAVGTYNDDGYSNWVGNSGAVYLYMLDETANMNSYAENPSGDYTLSPSTITTLLSTGQNVILQANNDISLLNDLIVNNTSGSGGILTLQAGRSIDLDANITTDNADLNIYANDTLANGVVDSERDAGNAEISLSAGKTINAGTGNVLLELRDGAGKTNSDSGNITIDGTVLANTVSLFNNGSTANSNIIMNAGSSITASSSGNAITASSPNGNFLNNAGNTAFSTPSGRWLVYSSDPASTTEGFTSYNKLYNKTYAGNPPATISSGNHFLYSIVPALSVTADDASRTYGSADPVFTYSAVGFIDGDTTVTSLSGLLGSTASLTSNVGNYYTVIGTLASNIGYNINFTGSDLSITPRALTVKADNKIKTIGYTNPALTASFSGFANSDNSSNLTGSYSLSSTATTSSKTGDYAINVSGDLVNANYTIGYQPGTLTIIPIDPDILKAIDPVLSSNSNNFQPQVSSYNFDIEDRKKNQVPDFSFKSL